ncbi:MAG TPA: hypothetical protein VF713_27175, partial [Thermoanaerobaculia bacterium]
PVHGRGELLRVPNRPDLYPNAGVTLRSPNGALLAPIVKNLTTPDITIDTEGYRRAVITLPVHTVGWMRCWCASMSADGVASAPIGPFSVAVGVAP